MRQRLYLSSLILLLCTACASTPHYTPRKHYSGSQVSARNKLAFYAMSLTGTPYRYGGESPRTGFDCSGFVQYVYRHSLGIHLPRTVRGQSNTGRSISLSQLRPGDLVFYHTGRHTYSHVGIYLGGNRFVHAPSSGKRVKVTMMSRSYWKNHYSGARRVILQ